MPSKTSRADNRAHMETAIRRLGREHLSTHGAAGLSLRAIARELGVVSSAVYRYVPSRDDLLTMLLVEGYTDLADTVDAAVDDVPDDDPRGRIRACAVTLRAWAVADPARWALLYGSPVPGYAAPPEQTALPGTRVVARLLLELSLAHAAGALADSAPADPALAPVPPAVAADLDSIRTEFGIDLPDTVFIGGMSLWSVMIGGTSLEVFGQYGDDTFADPGTLYAAQIDRTLSTLFD